MRMLDLDREQGVRVLQLYLSPAEAAGLHQALGELLVDAERNDRRHVFVAHMSRELSGSIVTPAKLARRGNTTLERRIFDER